MSGPLISLILTLLFFAYPFLIYQGLGHGLAWVAPALIAFLMLRNAWRAGSAPARAKSLALAALLGAGTVLFASHTTKLISVGIHGFLAWLFGRTLLHGPSIVERMVRLQFPEFPAGVSEYCRQVTWMWTLFFCANVLICALLALAGSDFAWMLYNGTIIFALMAILVIGEWFYRHRRFPDLDIPPPRESLDAMVRNGLKVWREIQDIDLKKP